MIYTAADLEMLATLIKGHYAALAISWFGVDAVGPKTVQALIAGGYVTEQEIATAGILTPSFKVGAEQVSGPDAPLDTWQQAAMQASNIHGAALVVGLGNTVANDMTTLAISSSNAQAEAYKTKIAAAVTGGLEENLTWKQIRGELGEALDGDYARDLDRIAATEVQRAVNEGYSTEVYKNFGGGAQVAVIPQPDACKTCLGFYLGGDGKPKIYSLEDLPGSTINFKKKKPEWVPCRPPAHPWCHCQLVYVPDGMEFDENWALQPG